MAHPALVPKTLNVQVTSEKELGGLSARAP